MEAILKEIAALETALAGERSRLYEAIMNCDEDFSELQDSTREITEKLLNKYRDLVLELHKRT